MKKKLSYRCSGELSGSWQPLIVDKESWITAERLSGEYYFAREYPHYAKLSPRNTVVEQKTRFKRGAEYSFYEVFADPPEFDPSRAPHVELRNLRRGDYVGAFKFLERWGSLLQVEPQESATETVDLAGFWEKHARLRAVTRLYEEVLYSNTLRHVWFQDIYGEHGAGLVGCVPASALQWQVEDLGEFQKALSGGPTAMSALTDGRLQGLTYEVISSELRAQAVSSVIASWEKTVRGSQVTFRSTRTPDSLWSAIWEMFGADISGPGDWRSCRICGDHFFPIQTNTTCCKPEHQALWSKRMWARRRRSEGSAAEKDRGGPGKSAHSPQDTKDQHSVPTT